MKYLNPQKTETKNLVLLSLSAMAGKPFQGNNSYSPNVPPVEGETEDQLGVVGKPLHERVDDDQAHAGGAQEHAVPVQLQQHEQPQAQLTSQEGQSIEEADLENQLGLVSNSEDPNGA